MEQLNIAHRDGSEAPQAGSGSLMAPLVYNALKIVFLIATVAAVNFSIACAGGAKQAQSADKAISPQAATAEMERIYGLILQRFEQDDLFIAKFQAAQTAWKQYRDAHLEALYPAKDKRLAYGSVYGRCRQTALAELTRQRIEQLRPWLDGVAEGDVCAGSLPRR